MSIGRKLRRGVAAALRKVGIDAHLLRRRIQNPDDAAPEWYDNVYATSDVYAAHYSKSDYLILWEAIAARVSPGARILEIGCGPGQLAHLLADRGLPEAYVGFDISEVAVAAARERVPDYRFEVANALTTDLVDSDYDLVICTEVLEHIQGDLEVLRRVQSGVRVLATVPDFSSETHVRWFRSARAARRRYRRVLRDLTVESVTHESGWTIFLLDGLSA